MKSFPDKIREARCALGLSQSELGEAVGVSMRSIISYEKGQKHPRDKTIYQLAKALHVSIRYLKDEECDDPTADIEKDVFIAGASDQYGAAGAKDVTRMLEENTALFAGGELSQEEKDTYFNALMTAYITCRETAKEKYGRKK